MNFQVLATYGLESTPLLVTGVVGVDATSVSEVYVELRLPADTNRDQLSVETQVPGAAKPEQKTKVKTTIRYTAEDGPGVDVKATSGGAAYQVAVTAQLAGGAEVHGTGQTGSTITLQLEA
jgi:hypothetical protein